MELMPESQKAEEVISNDPNAEYITVSRLSDDIVQLVQGSGGQVTIGSLICIHFLHLFIKILSCDSDSRGSFNR